jgi:hypothetical protein
MEVLNALFHKADEWDLFPPLGLRKLPYSACLYVDDLVLLLCLRQQDLLLLRQILEILQSASGLSCNLRKCQMTTIRCDED